MNQKN